MATPPDPLDPLFARWRDDTPELRRSVTTEVWHRIESAEESRRTSHILARLETLFSRPAFAAVFVLACVFLGLFLAETRSSAAHRERSATLERYRATIIEHNYLRMLDPRIETFDAPAPAAVRHQP